MPAPQRGFPKQQEMVTQSDRKYIMTFHTTASQTSEVAQLLQSSKVIKTGQIRVISIVFISIFVAEM